MSAYFFYLKNVPKSIEQLQVNTLVLIFCFEFQELSHLTCDLSQAELNLVFTFICLGLVEEIVTEDCTVLQLY